MRYATVLSAVIGLACSFRAASAQNATSTSLCRPADQQSAGLIDYIKALETTTDSEQVNARNNIYHLPVVSTTQIALVTDARTCAKASAAYGPPTGSTTSPLVYVIQLGKSGYAVLDPTQLAGEYRTVMIFDRQWKKLGGWTGG